MRRRAVLKGVAGAGGALALSGLGVVGGARTDGYEPIGVLDVEGAAEAVVSDDGETVYLAASTGFATVDVSDPADPTVLAEVRDVAADRERGPMTSILDVKLDGDRLLVSGPAQRGPLAGLVVYDVSDPADPTPATDFYETGYSIHNSFLLGDYAYLTRNSGGQATMAIVDVSGQSPEPVGIYNPLDYEADVEGWDELGSFPGVLHDLYVHEDVAYCAFWDAGTWMVDVSDPANPSTIARVGDYSLAELVELSKDRERLSRYYGEAPGNDHYVAVDDDASIMAVGGEAWDNKETVGGGPAGVDLWDISDRTNPEKLSTIDPVMTADTSRRGTWTTSHNFDLHGDRLYTSWYEAGVKVHDVSDPANPELLAWWRQPDEAMFWTAQMAVPDEFYVASSYGIGGHRSGLYTFPDRAGQQADAPTFPTPTPDPTPTATRTRTETDRGTPTRTETTDDGTGGTGGSVDQQSGGATATDTRTETDAGDGQSLPGFGVTTALAGLGIGVYSYLRRRD